MIFFLLVPLFVFLFYVFFTWNDHYWEKRGVPFKKPSFFFGNFKEALTGKRQFGLVYCDMYDEFKNAAYVGFIRMRSPVIILRDLEQIKNILVKDFPSFASNEFHIDPVKDPILGENPFFRSGDDWKHARSQWSSSMTSSRVKAIFETMVEKADIMTEHVNNHISQSAEPLESRDLATKYLTDVIVNSVLGLQINSFEEPNNVFRRISGQLFTSDYWTMLVFFSTMITPWINDYFGLGFLSKEIQKQIYDISGHIVTNRKKHGFSKHDFFEATMRNDEKKGKNNYGTIASRLFGFLSDGIETSSGVIAFTMYELAANPQLQSRLREELNEAAGANGGTLSYEHIQNLPYLEMVFLEVMRLYPPGFVLQRICTKDYTLPAAVEGGKSIVCPKGMPVVIPVYALHHDPNIYPDPEKFDPERFSEENKEQIPKYSYLPFGEGPRICVGQRLASTQSKYCIASIIRNFELRVSPKTKPRPLALEPNAIVTRAIGDLWVTFHKIH